MARPVQWIGPWARLDHGSKVSVRRGATSTTGPAMQPLDTEAAVRARTARELADLVAGFEPRSGVAASVAPYCYALSRLDG